MEVKAPKDKNKSHNTRAGADNGSKWRGKSKAVAPTDLNSDPSEPTIEDLVLFKRLKEEGNGDALAAWQSFQSNHDEKEFHRSIHKIIASHNSNTSASNSSNSSVPPLNPVHRAAHSENSSAAILPVPIQNSKESQPLSTAIASDVPLVDIKWGSADSNEEVGSKSEGGLLSDIFSSLRIGSLLSSLDSPIKPESDGHQSVDGAVAGVVTSLFSSDGVKDLGPAAFVSDNGLNSQLGLINSNFSNDTPAAPPAISTPQHTDTLKQHVEGRDVVDGYQERSAGTDQFHSEQSPRGHSFAGENFAMMGAPPPHHMHPQFVPGYHPYPPPHGPLPYPNFHGMPFPHYGPPPNMFHYGSSGVPGIPPALAPPFMHPPMNMMVPPNYPLPPYLHHYQVNLGYPVHQAYVSEQPVVEAAAEKSNNSSQLLEGSGLSEAPRHIKDTAATHHLNELESLNSSGDNAVIDTNLKARVTGDKADSEIVSTSATFSNEAKIATDSKVANDGESQGTNISDTRESAEPANIALASPEANQGKETKAKTRKPRKSKSEKSEVAVSNSMDANKSVSVSSESQGASEIPSAASADIPVPQVVPTESTTTSAPTVPQAAPTEGGSRSKALLSFLKSQPAAPVLNPFLKQQPSAPASSVESSQLETPKPALEAPAPPPTKVAPPVLSQKSPETAKVDNYEQKESEIDATVANKETVSAKEETKSPVQRNFRTTRNQTGTLQISLQNNKKQDFFPKSTIILSPGNFMNIYWTLLEADNNGASAGSNSMPDIVIGLNRYGALTNMPCIITKPIGKNYIKDTDEKGRPVLKGRMQFHAPKSPGRFVYRLFDQSSKESAAVTMAASMPFEVSLEDSDSGAFLNNMKFLSDLFSDKSNRLKAISQFATTMEFTHQAAVRRMQLPMGQLPQGHHIANQCTMRILDCIADAGKFIDMAKIKEQLEKSESAPSGTGDSKEKDQSQAEHFKMLQTSFKIHVEAHDALVALRKNPVTWAMVTPAVKEKIGAMESTYCMLLHRYFGNPEALTTARSEEFGFQPLVPRSDLPVNRQRIQDLDRAISQMLPTLFPKGDFDGIREDLRLRVQQALNKSQTLPLAAHITVSIYGSSKSNFGSDGADVDMCLALAGVPVMPIEEKRSLILEVAKALELGGFSNVEVIATARIPIVNFQDSLSGLDGDITFHNPLAVSNTSLLRTYSEIDPRIRSVAYLIKHWAKMRQINSPGDGTLSSYGYILCLIHFLQNRSQPIVPNLQAIPPSWSGENLRDNQFTLPERFQTNPADNSECNTYFYSPDVYTQGILKGIAAKNKESLIALLLEFFLYFSWRFDFKRDVVSIRSGSVVSKLEKAELYCWTMHERLSIEDPFEIGYDVAHVIKGVQMKYIRKEFLRGFSILFEALTTTSLTIESTLALLFEKADLPKFSKEFKKTHETDHADDDVIDD